MIIYIGKPNSLHNKEIRLYEQFYHNRSVIANVYGILNFVKPLRKLEPNTMPEVSDPEIRAQVCIEFKLRGDITVMSDNERYFKCSID